MAKKSSILEETKSRANDNLSLLLLKVCDLSFSAQMKKITVFLSVCIKDRPIIILWI